MPDGKNTTTVHNMAMIICTSLEEFLYQSIDPEEFQYPEHELIPPDQERCD